MHSTTSSFIDVQCLGGTSRGRMVAFSNKVRTLIIYWLPQIFPLILQFLDSEMRGGLLSLFH